ncbi:Nucleic-acid-binding protein from transposon X-element [Eumeta japonica]|uniref:Nucleic-acid-binding protein from transposon X-element n=1 Tax=Eumeta variegata TaxID=151549 RepID=A0A4C1SUD7_EUMVA|nr:Nucleic-acid-binding protein from transposon X-element [Eumeta japonica]
MRRNSLGYTHPQNYLNAQVTVGRGPCRRCQQFEHSSHNCHHPIRCVRCEGERTAAGCDMPREDKCTCANCAGPHTVIDKKCPVFHREASARGFKVPPQPPQGMELWRPTLAKIPETQHTIEATRSVEPQPPFNSEEAEERKREEKDGEGEPPTKCDEAGGMEIRRLGSADSPFFPINSLGAEVYTNREFKNTEIDGTDTALKEIVKCLSTISSATPASSSSWHTVHEERKSSHKDIRELLYFSGNYSGWLVFRTAYRQTSPYLEEIDNIMRLRKHIVGAAAETTKTLFINIYKRYGIPGTLVFAETKKLRVLPKIGGEPYELYE